MGNWQKWLSRWARWWNIIDHSQPNPTIRVDAPLCIFNDRAPFQTATGYRARYFPLTRDHVTERLRVVLHAWVFDLERLVYLAEEATPVRRPEEVGKVTVVPLKMDAEHYLELSRNKYQQNCTILKFQIRFSEIK